MTVLFDNRYEGQFDEEFFQMIEKIALLSLEYEDFDTDCEISVSLVDNNEIKDINSRFRNIDSATDVLSFPQLTFEEDEICDVNENYEIILGDIIISVERAMEQAKEYGHSLKREIAFLTAHSMLHLLGYDHMVKEEEEVMFKKQKEILNIAGIPRE